MGKDHALSKYGCNEIPIIKPFIVDNSFYIYDTYYNHIVKVNSNQYKEICDLLKVGVYEYRKMRKDTKGYNEIIEMLNKGYFRAAWIKEIMHPENDIVVYLLNRAINRLTLQVTHDCNMCCRYCNFSTENKIDRIHEKRHMSFDVAKQSIDFLYSHSKDIGKLYISFYGGEPFLNFNLIYNATNYANQIFELKDIQYNITTNGTIMTEEIISYLVKNKVFLSISLDGPKEIQNKHRLFSKNGMGSFDVVLNNIKKLQSYEDYFQKYVSFLPVLFPDERKDDVLEFFDKMGINSSNVIIRDADLRGIDYEVIQTRNKEEENYDKRYTDFCDVLNNSACIPEVWQHNGPCIPGVQKIFVNINGNIQICEKIIDCEQTQIGDIYNGFNLNKVRYILNFSKINEDQCKKCWCMRFCKICAAQCINVDKGEIDKSSLEIYCRATEKLTLSLLKKHVRIY